MDNPEKLATLGAQDTGQRQAKQKPHHYTQTNTNNENKKCALLQTGGKDESNLVFMRKSSWKTNIAATALSIRTCL